MNDEVALTPALLQDAEAIIRVHFAAVHETAGAYSTLLGFFGDLGRT